VLSLDTKLQIIADLQQGKSQRFTAEKFEVAKSTVCDIWKDRQKIQDCVSSSDSPVLAKKRCIIRDPKYELVDSACWQWFCQQRSRGAPVTGVLLQEKARSFFVKFYPDCDPDTFKGSTGWLRKFNLRHGIKNVALRGESLSADLSGIEPFKEELKKVMESEGLSPQQVYNADETGLWWRLTPSKSLNSAGKQTANFKKAKERVTILGCSNASGTHRLPLMFINKSKKPRCFKHMDMNNLPVHYYAQNKSWMNSSLFSEWYHNRFVPSVQRYCRSSGIEEKALLLLDNAPSHPSISSLQSDDGKIKVLFLPANTTSVIQPMDQGVLDPLKQRYKRKLLSHIIIENESSDLSVPDLLKKVTIKDAVYWVSAAWQEASNDSIRKSWKKLLPDDVSETSETSDTTASCDEVNDDTDIVPSIGSELEEDVTEWMESDNADPGHQILDDDEIVADLQQLEEEHSDDSEDEDPVEDSHPITPQEAFDALNVTLQWLESQGSDPNHLLLVKNWRDTAAKMRQETLKQTKLT